MEEVTTDASYSPRLFRADTPREYRGDFTASAPSPAYHTPGESERRPRHLTRGGASAAIGDTDVFLYRSYAIVERLRQAVAERDVR